MATLASNVLTLVDWAKRLDPNGSTSSIAELLNQTNEILDDMLWAEGNLPTGHRLTMRTGLPTVAWRLLNAGVPPSKSTTVQIDEGVGMLEAYSEVDKDLAELNGNLASFRLSEGRAFVEAMNQEMAQTLIYGNKTTAPEEFTGLANRYSALSGTIAQNVISGGGSGSDNTSIWLVGWGEQGVYGIFPKGSRAGLMQEDLGLVTVETANGIGGGRMRAYRDHWQWKCGFAQKDWRYVVRIPNIDVSNLIAESSAADIIKLMSRAMDRIPHFGMCRPVFYMNRTVYSMLRIQALSKSSNVLAVEKGLSQFGTAMTWMSFLGIPIRRVDQILLTEATVS